MQAPKTARLVRRQHRRPARHQSRYSAQERHTRPTLKGLARLPPKTKPQRKTPHICSFQPTTTRRKKGNFSVRTLIQTYFQAKPESAICVQNFDDSLNPAIRITYRSSQRSSSMCEPRHPLLKVAI